MTICTVGMPLLLAICEFVEIYIATVVIFTKIKKQLICSVLLVVVIVRLVSQNCGYS